ncbi:MAG: 30S ribosomal protein S18 [Bacteroidetes bacterium]|nr:30S ribosomal protein S18 [Bacteroidota bacterium]
MATTQRSSNTRGYQRGGSHGAPQHGGYRRDNAQGGQRTTNRQQIQRKKRTCRFCDAKDVYIDYKNEKRLQRFVSEQGKIIPRRITGTCTRHQRQLVRAIKRARHLALLSFVNDAVS